MKFNDLQLLPALVKAVGEAGYAQPSPIQEKAIPPVLAGKDLLACAQTGTGKTAAFALPILQLLSAHKPQGKPTIRALVLTPTRELALQIQESFESYGRHLPLRSAVIFGGVGQAPQVAQLRRGIDILVATPGRLNDLIGQGYIHLSSVEIFVLDEADRMLDMGFVHDVKKVVKLLPEKRQTLLFSATLPNEIIELAGKMLHQPERVFVTPVSSTVERINQCLYKVDKSNKIKLLASLLGGKSVSSALVFTRTKHGADRVVRDLKRAGISAAAIHGNKSQNARQEALARFKDGRVRVLVATDIAARGLDIAELSHVFNYDLPDVPETYVHRIGRTGRAGHGGSAVSFCCVDELEALADIEKLIGFAVPEVTDHAWPMENFAKTTPAMRQAAKDAARAARGQKGRQPAPAKPKPQPKAPPPAAPAQPAPAAKAKKPARGKGGQPSRRPDPTDPYSNLSGGKAIVTKRPAWSSTPAAPAPAAAPKSKNTRPDARTAQNAGQKPDKAQTPPLSEGDSDMSRNNNRRRRRPRSENSSEQSKPKAPAIPKNENGLFDFSEAELAEDTSLRVISTTSSETKYASFEDYMKDH